MTRSDKKKKEKKKPHNKMTARSEEKTKSSKQESDCPNYLIFLVSLNVINIFLPIMLPFLKSSYGKEKAFKSKNQVENLT